MVDTELTRLGAVTRSVPRDTITIALLFGGAALLGVAVLDWLGHAVFVAQLGMP